MKALIAILLIAFVSIAVFGFIGLAHGSIFSTCAMAVMSGSANCPVKPTAETSLPHAQIFKSFSESMLLAFLVLLTAAFIYFASQTNYDLPVSKAYYFSTNFQVFSVKSHFKTKLITWLKLLAKQDALAS